MNDELIMSLAHVIEGLRLEIRAAGLRDDGQGYRRAADDAARRGVSQLEAIVSRREMRAERAEREVA